jgi:hypothetical protein
MNKETKKYFCCFCFSRKGKEAKRTQTKKKSFCDCSFIRNTQRITKETKKAKTKAQFLIYTHNNHGAKMKT